ncbi:MAG: transglutaminase-like domain-containing protein [Verrucomicrobiota bacterium]|nr:transglutaminase-like domain-containing protein [Verrucomicrobiota bacterium]
MKLQIALTAAVAALLCAGCSRARDPEWQAEAAMDHQFFPALVIATASVRPIEEEDEEAKKPDPYLLGDKFGLLGVSIKTFAPNSDVKITVKENDVIAASTWSGRLPEANHDYYIAPKLSYKFDRLRKVSQQVPLNVDFAVEVNGKPLGDKAETLQIRSINDCPYGVANSEETVDDENIENGSADLGWMFAAYVNENHPQLDKILQEALATKIVNAFDGYQANDPVDVVKQVFAIWTALQKHGIKYSSVIETPGGSSLVNSQFVRFLDQSINMTQANCVDGSVLFASLLRKIGINPFLVALPDHMYIGFYVNNSDNEDEQEFVGLETTLIGASDFDEVSEDDMPTPLADLGEQLGGRVRNSKAWESFATAVTTATDDLEEKGDKLDAGDPNYQTIDIAEARGDGIMPISFEKSSP